MTFELTSSAFGSKDKIPTKYTAEGENVSPPLAWRDPPEGTVELALLVDDPDAPQPMPFVHWVRYGIPASATGLREGDRETGIDGMNEKLKPGWTGPLPPSGHGKHHYQFQLFALSRPVSLEPGATKTQLLAEIENRTLEKATLVGVYERPKATSAQH